MKVLILGGGGIIAHYLNRSAPAGTQLTLVWHKQQPQPGSATLRRCDLTRSEDVRTLLRETHPDVIFDAAGQSNVDACEQHPATARASNVDATRHVLTALREYPSRLIYLSTNAVYDGQHAPYREDSPRDPVNTYGRIKKECENLVSAAGQSIARLILTLGWSPASSRTNPLPWMVSTLRAGKTLNLVHDVRENVLPAPFAAQALWQLAATGFRGTLNIAGSEVVSRAELGLRVARVFGFDESLIHPVPGSFFPTIAPRPADTSYNTTKLRGLGLTPPPLDDALAQLRDMQPHNGG